METNRKLLRIAYTEDKNAEQMEKEIDRELNKVKHFAFGKVKVYSKPKKKRQLEKLQMKKINLANENTNGSKDDKMAQIDADITEILKEMHSEQFAKDVAFLETMKQNKGKSAATFNVVALSSYYCRVA